SARKKGIHSTVASTRFSAGDKPSGFSSPNQIKMIPREIRRDGYPQRRMKAAILRSRRSNCLKAGVSVGMSRVPYCARVDGGEPLHRRGSTHITDTAPTARIRTL